MSLINAFFSGLKSLYRQNPLIAFAVVWVTIVPAIGSTILIGYIYQNPHLFPSLHTITYFLVTLTAAMMMGLALCPTTLLAILSGYLWGWKVFPLLVVAYSLASLIGYFIGLKLDKNSLNILLGNYPKVQKIVTEKRHQIGTLVFFVRISPVIPFAFSNLLFASLKAGWKNVLIYGFMGMLPRTFMAFSLGLAAGSIRDAIENRSGGHQVIVFAVLLLLSIWGIVRFFKMPRSGDKSTPG